MIEEMHVLGDLLQHRPKLAALRQEVIVGVHQQHPGSFQWIADVSHAPPRNLMSVKRQHAAEG